MSERESMAHDVVIVGGGPAGLASAIRLKQRVAAEGKEISVCLLEKGSRSGAHPSGAVIDPRGLDELLPNWREMDGHPLTVEVSSNHHWISQRIAARFPAHPAAPVHGQ